MADITGIYLRAKRDGRFESLDVAEMTDTELLEAFERKEAGELKRWVVALAGWIRDNVSASRSGGDDG